MTDWTNEETALAWACDSDQVVAIVGCHPENPPEPIDARTALRLFSQEEFLRIQTPDLPHGITLSERIDWEQIAAQLNLLLSPESATGPMHDWYIAASEDESRAFGVGQSPAQARLYNVAATKQAIEKGPGVFTTPATKALVDEIRNTGESTGWSYTNGVACTYDEIRDRLND